MEKNEGKKSFDTFVSALIGCAVAAGLALVLVSLCAALSLLSGDPASLDWLGLAALFICCFAGGLVGAKRTETKPFLSGMIGGVMFFCTVLVISLMTKGEIQAVFIPVSLCCVTAGAFLGCIRRDKNARIPAFDDKKYSRYFDR